MEANPVQLQHAMYPPLEHETRTNVETAAAAHYLLRAPQTLRIWACRENGPIVSVLPSHVDDG